VLVSSFSEISEDEYLDPRTAQVGKVDHVSHSHSHTYLDPRTAQVGKVDHVKQPVLLSPPPTNPPEFPISFSTSPNPIQYMAKGRLQRPFLFTTKRTSFLSSSLIEVICTEIRPARDEELPTPYIEDYRCALDAEVSKYVAESYPKGVCSVYCTSGKDVEEPGFDFELVQWKLALNMEH
ncbi:F-actin capping protein, alpha subunit, conserved site-containing protein, partial [Cynara cardunculus var. scolymus]